MAIEVHPPTELSLSSPDKRNGHHARALTVLVVDDEPAFCFAMAEILGLSGHHVEQAHSVSDALSFLAGKTPDLILTDIMMPDADGLAFICELRSRLEWANIPAIVVSAKAQVQDKEAAYSAGADGYLVKPFSAQELQQAIRVYAIA